MRFLVRNWHTERGLRRRKRKQQKIGPFTTPYLIIYGGRDVTHFSADHLYGARLTLDKKFDKKSCTLSSSHNELGGSEIHALFFQPAR